MGGHLPCLFFSVEFLTKTGSKKYLCLRQGIAMLLADPRLVRGDLVVHLPLLQYLYRLQLRIPPGASRRPPPNADKDQAPIAFVGYLNYTDDRSIIKRIWAKHTEALCLQMQAFTASYLKWLQARKIDLRRERGLWIQEAIAMSREVIKFPTRESTKVFEIIK